jgi:ureidoglycolate hydrolase
MDENLMDISEYDGTGYKPLINYGAWRVAILRWEQSLVPENTDSMERHTQTDEVFVLLNGQATLILGGNRLKPEVVSWQVMENGKLYNVKRNAWHTVMLSRDATILIVENQDTGQENTEYSKISQDIKQVILALDRGA